MAAATASSGCGCDGASNWGVGFFATETDCGSPGIAVCAAQGMVNATTPKEASAMRA